MRHGRGFPRQPTIVIGGFTERADIILQILGQTSFSKVGTVTTNEQSGGGDQDHTEILTGLNSHGRTPSSLNVATSHGPEPEIVLLAGVSTEGKVGQLTIQGNSGSGWVLVTDAASVWRRVEDFRHSKPLGGVDFAPTMSDFGSWKISVDTDTTILLRSETSISNDTLVEGRP